MAQEGDFTQQILEQLERRRGRDEANRPRLLKQDAELAGLGKDDYRRLLEAVLAQHIMDMREVEGDDEEFRLLNFEVNGLCMALRLLGGYEGFCFDDAWAQTVPPASFDWHFFFNGEPPEPLVVTVAGQDGQEPSRFFLSDKN